MRIAIVKPDWGVRGGFELVLERVTENLAGDGHDLRWLSPKVAPGVPPRPLGVPVDGLADIPPEFLLYAGMMEQFLGLDAGRADLVISTQPPSFVTGHPRHLSLFYHHFRSYYDLADLIERTGLVDVDIHREATSLVRAMDQPFLERVTYFLAGSPIVKDRLHFYNGLTDNVGTFHAGIGVGAGDPSPRVADEQGVPLMISRHEFPKRTELFVHAMKLLDGLTGIAIGAGGRLGYVQELDSRLSELGPDVASLDSEAMWLCNAPYLPPTTASTHTSNVRFEGFVSDDDLERHLRSALCVVAPAYLEDYGLTVIEAMAHGKPAIVCSDGGNLVNLVDDGTTGFVVSPSGPAIAAAIRKLWDDPGLAKQMGAAARDASSAYTWDRALAQLHEGIERVMS
jgi:glycosyltransferase involved in cell wall biosynthesis